MKKLELIIGLVFVVVSLFGRQIDIDGNTTINETLTTMDRLVLSEDSAQISGCLPVLQNQDANTQIEVEQNPDKDLIRLMIEGQEVDILPNGRLESMNEGNSDFVGESVGQNSNGIERYNTALEYLADTVMSSSTSNNYGGACSGGLNTEGGDDVSVGEITVFRSTGNRNAQSGL